MINNTKIKGGRCQMGDYEAYCVKCKAKREMKEGKIVTNEKGRRMAKGICPECGTKMTKFLKSIK